MLIYVLRFIFYFYFFSVKSLNILVIVKQCLSYLYARQKNNATLLPLFISTSALFWPPATSDVMFFSTASGLL